MITLGKGFCVFAGIAGIGYCIWLLLDCWRHVRFHAKPTTPASYSGSHGFISTRAELLCQLVFAAVAIWLAVTLVMAHCGDVSSLFWQPVDNEQHLSKRTEGVTWSETDFGAKLRHDSTRTGRPVIGIDCAFLRVTDEQVASLLHRTPELEWLNLAGTPITGAILGELTCTPSLCGLVLYGDQITDSQLAHLKALTELESLDLANTRVTDEGLAHLRELTKLQTLDLANTRVTDEGFTHLRELTKLQVLNLTNTRVTDEGVKAFQQALPYCESFRLWLPRL
jgi:Leucine Rich repeats (2 copies)/Leucine Rich repeat